MLIFSRKPGQKIKIGDDIEIAVLEVRRGQVRIGIDAPKRFSVHREEIYQKILEENRLAALSAFNAEGDLDDINIEDRPRKTP